MDSLGTRRGFMVIMIFWSLACASHGLATGFAMLAASRFLLGMGEGGGFPAATRAVAEWFPTNERATAMGIINAGTAVGAVVAPPLIAVILFTPIGAGFSLLRAARIALDGMVAIRLLSAGESTSNERYARPKVFRDSTPNHCPGSVCFESAKRGDL